MKYEEWKCHWSWKLNYIRNNFKYAWYNYFLYKSRKNPYLIEKFRFQADIDRISRVLDPILLKKSKLIHE